MADQPATSQGHEADSIIERHEALKSDRRTMDVLWDDVARYILQTKGNILTKLSPGQAQTTRIYDTTAEEALNVGAAGMLTHIMPAGEKWFQLAPKSKKASAAVTAWMDKLSDAALDLIYTSNFYQTIHEDLIYALGFGTSLMMLEEGKRKRLNFINIPVGKFCIEEDAEGVVDVVTREFQWTARQAKQKWGEAALGPIVRAALGATSTSAGLKKFTFIHLVEPRADVDYKGGLVAGKLRPIRSIYICKEDRNIVSEDGYYEMPSFCSRLMRTADEVMGRGPGTQVMPEIKLVNAMEKDMMVAVELMVRPPWLIPNESDVDVPENVPDGVIYYDSQAGGGHKPEQLQYKNKIELGEQKTEQKREHIRKAFFNDLFQAITRLAEMKKEKTAYEVQQLVAEKMILFSPIFARYINEKTNPMIERVVGIILRNNLIEPAPPEMQGQEYEITYTSKIALAIKSAENQALATMMSFVEQMAALDQTVPMLIKWNEGARLVARNVGLPAALIRSPAEVDKLVKAHQQQVAQQQALDQANSASQAVKNLGPQAQVEAGRKIMSALPSSTGKPGMAA